MFLMFIAVFVLIFSVLLIAVKVGLKFVDARQKKQVLDMLHTASGETPSAHHPVEGDGDRQAHRL